MAGGGGVAKKTSRAMAGISAGGPSWAGASTVRGDAGRPERGEAGWVGELQAGGRLAVAWAAAAYIWSRAVSSCSLVAAWIAPAWSICRESLSR
jgi:hypothetical protein